MKVTFLGTGTSQGVPVIGCRCEVCRSQDSRDKRLRTSAMVEQGGVRIIIDAGPDFREQMLRAQISHIDAILLTHQHKDHIGGLDDVRAFNFVDYPIIHKIDIYANEATEKCVRKDFDYAFAENKYIGAPEMELHKITHDKPFYVKGLEIIPIKGEHSQSFSVTGYRIGGMAYLTDFKHISDKEAEKLQGVEALVVNALRFEPHHSHFNVEEAMQLINRIKPQRAWFTHLSHDIGLHAQTSRVLANGVSLAYDTLSFEL